MKRSLLAIVLCAASAGAQKMTVTIYKHKVTQQGYTQYVPGVSMNNGTANVNCGAYGYTANCAGSANRTGLYVPPHSIDGVIHDILLILVLPDGRSVRVGCQDRPHTAWSRGHACKLPPTDKAEADFDGSKVKLRWIIGIDGKKTEAETFMVGTIVPAGTPPSALEK